MSSTSPVNQGFRAVFREPAIVLAEIAWRWSFGLAAWALVVASLCAYLDSLPAGNLTLDTNNRWLVVAAVARVLHESHRLLAAMAIVVPAIFLLWIAAATMGRAATLKALLGRDARIALAPQLGLNFLRAAVTLAALIAYLGAAIIAGRAAAGADDVQPGVFLLVFIALAAVVVLVRSCLNWFLSLAAISAAREGQDTFTAIAAAVGLFRRQTGSFVAAAAIFGTLHAVLFAFYTVIGLLILSLAGRVPPVLTLLLLAATTLAYFAAVDFVNIARLAAYIAIDDGDRTPPPPAAPEPIPSAPQPDLPLISGTGLPTPEGAGS
jgi:hypothetical protein